MCGEDDGGESVVEGGAGGGGGIGSEMGWGVEREWVFDKGLSVELGEKKIVKYSVRDRIYVLGSITQRVSQWKTTSASIHRSKCMACLMVLPPYVRATTLNCTLPVPALRKQVSNTRHATQHATHGTPSASPTAYGNTRSWSQAQTTK